MICTGIDSVALQAPDRLQETSEEHEEEANASGLRASVDEHDCRTANCSEAGCSRSLK